MWLRTIGWMVTLTLGLLTIALPANGQQPQIPRIGYLRASAPPERYVKAFTQGLEEAGFVVGQTITIEYRHAAKKPERLPALAQELIDLGVDVIFGGGTNAVRVLQQATHTIPIVMISADPLADGFVASLDRPGGNITGFSMMARELSVKRVELLKKAFPDVSRLALFWDPTGTRAAITLQATESAARSLGLEVHSLAAQGPSEFAKAFAMATENRAQALVFLPSLNFNTHRKQLAEMAAATRLPAMYEHGTFAKTGGLMSYGPSIPDLMRRAGLYIGRIVNGAKPAELPVQQPTKFELVINQKTANQMGLTIPPMLLFQATEVIQ